MMRSIQIIGLTISMVISSVNISSGAIITLDATDSGFVTTAGGSAKGDGTISAPATYNYSVGQEEHYVDGSLGMPPGTTPLAFMDRNNYLIFDLSSVTGTIVSASLKLPTGLFESVDATETFDLVAPLDPGAALFDSDSLAVGNATGFTEFDEPTDPLVSVAAALYGNIEGGAGAVLGSTVISSGDDFTTKTIFFGPAGLGYLSSFIGGPVFLGGNVSTVTGVGTTEQPFGGVAPGIPAAPPGSDPSVPMLVLETVAVPEPSIYLLGAFGLLAIRLLRPRSRG